LKLEEAAIIFFPDMLENIDARLRIPAQVILEWQTVLESMPMISMGWGIASECEFRSYASALIFKKGHYLKCESGHSAVITKSLTWNDGIYPNSFWLEDSTDHMKPHIARRLLQSATPIDYGGNRNLFWKLL